MAFYFNNSNHKWGFYRLGKDMVIDLGVKYDHKKVIITIIDQFTKFKNQVRKGLKEVSINDTDISEIISTLQKNYKEIYPDNNGTSDIVKSTNEKTIALKPDITFEEWQSQYISKRNTLTKSINFFRL